jgi:uncharacterized membrane protein (DUF4010 family)
MGMAAAVAAWLMHRRAGAGSTGKTARTKAVRLRNPFSLTEASKFAAVFAVVLLLVRFVQAELPATGLYMVAGLAGLTDVDAITLSMAEYGRSGDHHVAVDAIVIATLANTIVKCAMVVALGAGALSRPVIFATSAILVTGIGAIVLF